MGKNSIERGSRDTWTITPTRDRRAARRAIAQRSRRAARRPAVGGGGRRRRCGNPVGGAAPTTYFDECCAIPRSAIRAATSSRPISPTSSTATKFVNALRKTGVTVHRATAPFTVAGKTLSGRLVRREDGAGFRPHVLDMFEPQDHPNDFAYPGGPPKPPYDNAG